MLKRCMILVFLALAFCWNTCQAEILPPHGEGQIGWEAVVLCERLTVREDRSVSSKAVKTLRNGDVFIVQNQWDGWADCFLSDDVDAGPAGWVNSDYIITDPAWYRTEEATPVYAWNDTMAPKVALLSKDTILPILKDDGDWLVIGLRGAAGWIQKTAADRMSAAAKESVQSISGLEKAILTAPKGTYTITDAASLQWIVDSFSIAQPIMSAGCPFDAVLTLCYKDGSAATFFMATDSCHNFRTPDGSYFAYGDNSISMYTKTEAKRGSCFCIRFTAPYSGNPWCAAAGGS